MAHSKAPVIKKLETKSGWIFQIRYGKKGKARWTLYDDTGKCRAVCAITAFIEPEEAEKDIREICDALDKRLFGDLFEQITDFKE